MKKIIVSLILLAGMMVGAQAQESNGNRQGGQRSFDPEKMAQMHAQRVAEALLLSEAETASFIPMYIEYSKEFMSLNGKFRMKHIDKDKLTDADVDAQIRNNFKKSRAILDLREAWYEKFLAVLSPVQLQKMYEHENNMGKAASEMHAHRSGGQNGQHGQHGQNGQHGGHGGYRGQGGQDRPSVQPKTKTE